VIEAKRQPAPLGALFEAAFRRFGAHITAYLLWSIGFGAVAAIIALVARMATGGRVAFALLFGGVLLSHFLLAGALTALVTATLRSRAVAFTAAALLASAVMFVGALFIGPLIGVVYPLLVFAPIAAAAGDAPAGRAFLDGARLALGDWGRSYAALCGIGLCVFFLWVGLAIALTPLFGTAGQVAVLVLTVLLCSPIAALVERNLYGDLTGRNVLPPHISRDPRPSRRA
jgi:hypothetical protein